MPTCCLCVWGVFNVYLCVSQLSPTLTKYWREAALKGNGFILAHGFSALTHLSLGLTAEVRLSIMAEVKSEAELLGSGGQCGNRAIY